jgi:signal-transduction protein with cAMP-binding, CBS, and nucleotidyltransferase domain
MPHRMIGTLIQNQKIVTIQMTSSVADTARLMQQRKIGAIMVVAQGRISGIFTERDALFRVLAQGRDPNTTAIGEVMTRNPQTIPRDRPFGHALHMMYEGGFRHVPVVEDGVPIGMVSARDVLGPELEEFACDLQRREQIAESLG